MTEEQLKEIINHLLGKLSNLNLEHSVLHASFVSLKQDSENQIAGLNEKIVKLTQQLDSEDVEKKTK